MNDKNINLSSKQILQYSNWIFNDCNSPISEIEFLIELIMKSDKSEEFYENITDLLTNKN